MAKRTAKVLGAAGSVDLAPGIYDQPFNGPLVHECVIAELAARRQGTHSTKTRGLVSGGSGKPWRQKGTGRARAGSDRSPLWKGGGTVFGPSPRHYTMKVNRKARRAGLCSALSVHAERGSLFVLDSEGFTEPSTKRAVEILGDIQKSSVLMVLSDEETAVAKSFRNVARVTVIPATDVGIADIVGAATLIMSRAALGSIEARTKVTEAATA